MNDACPSPPRVIRVMCVDDHKIFREGLAAALANSPEFRLVAEASTGEEAIEQFRAHKPDVTLMDLRLPGMSGLDAIVNIRQMDPEARIVALTTEMGDVRIQRVLMAGAKGYVSKGMGIADLLDVIRAAYEGKTKIPDNVASNVAAHLGGKTLSQRELEVLRRVAAGRRNKGVADDLGITEETVKMHLKSILSKLHANDRTHAVTIAIQRGFIELNDMNR